MRKIISIVLAFTLCLSISTVFCFADNSNELPEIDLGSGSIPDNSSQNPSGNNNNNNNNNPSFNDPTNPVIDNNDVTVNEPSTGLKDDSKDTSTNDNTSSSSSNNNSSSKESNKTDTNDSSSTGNNSGKGNGSDKGNDTNTDTNIDTGSIINSTGNPTSPSSSSESSSSSQEELSISYSDVEANKWYASDVAKATELGLINGYDGKFYPEKNLTYSEAIKLAACMHQLKTTGKVTLVNGTKNWYDTYVEYAKQNNIISKDYVWTANATRAGYVEIFAHALPDDALKAKNEISDGVIPDVAMSDYAASEIYKLYRAGILIGSDAKGTFNPNSNILRCEVAAILTRMMDESARKTISLI